MTFIDLFAGIGGFRRGMELAGHRCVGFCEYDKFAVASYMSMHLLTNTEREEISEIPRKRRVGILNDEIRIRKKEWYARDIRKVRADDIPKCDCWCFGFPCQDISIAGNRLGFVGRRSSLFFAVTGLIRDLEEKDRPSYLLIENVKNLFSVNGGFDFARLLIELDEIGYDAEWSLLNSADVVPQNRERVYIVGHLRGRRTRKVFSISGTDRIHTGSMEDRPPDNKIAGCLTSGANKSWTGNFVRQFGNVMPTAMRDNPNQGQIYDPSGIYTNSSPEFQRPPLPGVSQCLKADKHDAGVVMRNTEPVRIRRLTPRECFRLQGWDNPYFDRAELVNSDSQLYKQAGNGVTVTVVERIAREMEINPADNEW